MEYRREIDGLRALAVLSVIFHHFDAELIPSGYLGVDIFFVISGYVITGSILSRSYCGLGDLLLDFYSRRVKRLVPALAVCVLITSVTICFFNPDPKFSLKTGVAALFGVSNIYLFRKSADYFADSTALNSFTQTWSLGVEEQFYFVFPMIIWFVGIRSISKLKQLKLSELLTFLALVSLIGFIFTSQLNQSAAFYLMPTRFWELAAGSLVYLWKNTRQQDALKFPRASSLSSVALVAILVWVPLEFQVGATVAVVTLTMVVVWSAHEDPLVRKLLTQPSLVYLGKISYSLYLYHWSVLSISRWTIGVYWWTAPFQLLLMLLLAMCSHRFIEVPLRYAEWSTARSKTIASGLAGIAATALVLWVLAKPLSGTLYAGTRPTMEAVGVPSLLNTLRMPDGSSGWDGDPCVLSDNNQVGKQIDISSCTLGKFFNAKRRVLVIGNSFSAAFVQAFVELVATQDYAVTITSSWGASVVPEIENKSPWDKANDYYWAEVVPSLIEALRDGDVVFLVNDMASFSPNKSNDVSETLKKLKVGLENLSKQLSENGIALAVLDGLPFAREAQCEPTIAARQWFAPFGGPCIYFSKEETLLRRQTLNAVLRELQQSGIVTVVDLLDIFCPGDVCDYYSINGDMLYRDVWSHPSVEAARLSAPKIREVLTAISRGKGDNKN